MPASRPSKNWDLQRTNGFRSDLIHSVRIGIVNSAAHALGSKLVNETEIEIFLIDSKLQADMYMQEKK